MRETKEDLNKWRVMSYSWTQRFNIVKMSVLPKLIYKFSIISVKSQLHFFLDIDKIKFNSVTQSCRTLCDPMNCSMPGLPVHHQLTEFTQIHVHSVSDAIQPSHPLSSPSPPGPNSSQHQGLFQWVSSSHQVAEVLEFQLQYQSLQWRPRTDLLWDGMVGSPCSPRDSQESSDRKSVV